MNFLNSLLSIAGISPLKISNPAFLKRSFTSWSNISGKSLISLALGVTLSFLSWDSLDTIASSGVRSVETTSRFSLPSASTSPNLSCLPNSLSFSCLP